MPKKYRYRCIAIREGRVIHDEIKTREFLTQHEFCAALEGWNRAAQSRTQTGVNLQWVYAPIGVEV